MVCVLDIHKRIIITITTIVVVVVVVVVVTTPRQGAFLSNCMRCLSGDVFSLCVCVVVGWVDATRYGFDLYRRWSGTALISAWRSAVQASCFVGLLLWVLYFLKQLQDWDILDGTNVTTSSTTLTTTTTTTTTAPTTTDVLNATLNASTVTLLFNMSGTTTATTTTATTTQSTSAGVSADGGGETVYTTLYNVRAHINAVAEMNSVIEEYVSFMLIFYTILNVNNYLRVFKCAMHLQQSIENLALNFVAVYPAFQKTKRSKYQLYR